MACKLGLLLNKWYNLLTKAKTFKFSLVFFLSLFNSLCIAQKVDTIIFNGPSLNRIDISQMGDGWTSPSQSPPMIEDLNSHIENMFSVPVYERYSKFFNVFRVEHFRSGPPSGTGWQTRSNVQYYVDYLNNAAPYTDIRYVVSREGRGHDKMADGFNTGHFSDNVFAAPTLDPDMIAMHLIGHSWHGFGDIYDNGGGGDLGPNKSTDPNTKEWEHWLGFTEPFNGFKVGVFPIGGVNAYRELNTSDQMMADIWGYQRMPIVYSPAERETIVQNIYSYCDPIDNYLNNNIQLQDPNQIQIKVIDTDLIQINWYLDGNLIVENGGEVFNLAQYVTNVGQFKIRAHAFDRLINYAYSDRGGVPEGQPGSLPSDSLDWVRKNFDNLQQSIEWDVNMTGSGIGHLSSAKLFHIDNNFMEFTLFQTGNYSVGLYSLQGVMLKTLANGSSIGKRLIIDWNAEDYSNQIILIKLKQGDNIHWYKWFGVEK